MISYHLHQLLKIIKAMTDSKRLPPSKDMNIAYIIYSLSLTRLNKPHFNKLFLIWTLNSFYWQNFFLIHSFLKLRLLA